MEAEDVTADAPASAWRGIGLSAAAGVIVATALLIAAVTAGAQAPAARIHRIAILTYPSPPPPSAVADLVINAKTAKALGLTVPPGLRLQATEVLE